LLKLFVRRIDNRYILGTALAMLALGVIVPGGFGIKPPQWFADHPPSLVTQQIAGGNQKTLPTAGKTTASDTQPVEQSAGAAPAQPAKTTPDKTPKETVIAMAPDLNNAPKVTANPAPAKKVTVPSKFVKHIPAKHLEKSGEAQKQSFITMVLPLILASNNELLERRKAVEAAAEAQDRTRLEQWAELYRIDPKNLNDAQLIERLRRRVDTIPVAIALAQAAVESGWGTSRFVLQGNALFGQWAWTESAGMRPLSASNNRAVVRSFASLLESVRAYMHNLNTHQNYRQFRDARQRLNHLAESKKTNNLVAYLDSYAEIGKEYVSKLLVIINSNKLNKYANAQLG